MQISLFILKTATKYHIFTKKCRQLVPLGALPLELTGGTAPRPPFLPSHFQWPSAAYGHHYHHRHHHHCMLTYYCTEAACMLLIIVAAVRWEAKVRWSNSKSITETSWVATTSSVKSASTSKSSKFTIDPKPGTILVLYQVLYRYYILSAQLRASNFWNTKTLAIQLAISSLGVSNFRFQDF